MYARPNLTLQIPSTLSLRLFSPWAGSLQMILWPARLPSKDPHADNLPVHWELPEVRLWVLHTKLVALWSRSHTERQWRWRSRAFSRREEWLLCQSPPLRPAWWLSQPHETSLSSTSCVFVHVCVCVCVCVASMLMCMYMYCTCIRLRKQLNQPMTIHMLVHIALYWPVRINNLHQICTPVCTRDQQRAEQLKGRTELGGTQMPCHA